MCNSLARSCATGVGGRVSATSPASYSARLVAVRYGTSMSLLQWCLSLGFGLSRSHTISLSRFAPLSSFHSASYPFVSRQCLLVLIISPHSACSRMQLSRSTRRRLWRIKLPVCLPSTTRPSAAKRQLRKARDHVPRSGEEERSGFKTRRCGVGRCRRSIRQCKSLLRRVHASMSLCSGVSRALSPRSVSPLSLSLSPCTSFQCPLCAVPIRQCLLFRIISPHSVCSRLRRSRS